MTTVGTLSAIAFMHIIDNIFISSAGVLRVLTALFLNLFQRTHRVDLARIDLPDMPLRY